MYTLMADSMLQKISIIIMHAFIMRTHLVVVLNQRRWQSLNGEHGKGVEGLFEKVSF